MHLPSICPIPSNSLPLKLKLNTYIKADNTLEISILSDKLLLSYVNYQKSNTYVLKSGTKQLSLITGIKLNSVEEDNGNNNYKIYLSNPNAQWSNIEFISKSSNSSSLNLPDKFYILADEASNLGQLVSLYWKLDNNLDTGATNQWLLMTDKDNFIASLEYISSEKGSNFILNLSLGLSRDTILLILTSVCKLIQIILN